jgi:hypothetical protein
LVGAPDADGAERRAPDEGVGPTGTVAPNAASLAGHVPGFLAQSFEAANAAATPAPAVATADSPWLKEVGTSAPAPEYRPPVSEPEPAAAPAPKRSEGSGGAGIVVAVAVLVLLGLGVAGFLFRDKLGFKGAAHDDAPVHIDAKPSKPPATTAAPPPATTSPASALTAEPSAAVPVPKTIPTPLPIPTTQPVQPPTPVPNPGVRPPPVKTNKPDPKFTPTEL